MLDNNIVPEGSDEAPKENSKAPKSSSLGEMLDKYKNEPPVPLIIPGIKEASMGFVFGPPKSGKTIYLENLLLSVAAGKGQFNGYPLRSNNRKVLFVSYEEITRFRMERAEKQRLNFTPEEQVQISKNYFVSNQNMPRYVLGKQEWKALSDEIELRKPGIVVIDSLSRLTMDDNGDEENAKQIAKQLSDLATTFQCTVIVINHTPKGTNERPLTVFSMSGSRIFMQEANFLIGINKAPDNTRYIKIVASRYDRDGYDTVDTFTFDNNLGIQMTGKEYESNILATFDGRHNTANRDIVLSEIQKVVTKSGKNAFKSSDLKHLLKPSGLMAKPTYNGIIKELTRLGKIKNNGKGSYEYLATNNS